MVRCDGSETIDYLAMVYGLGVFKFDSAPTGKIIDVIDAHRPFVQDYRSLTNVFSQVNVDLWNTQNEDKSIEALSDQALAFVRHFMGAIIYDQYMS